MFEYECWQASRHTRIALPPRRDTYGSFCKSKKSSLFHGPNLSDYSTCKACAECKPQYHQSAPMNLIKATQPFEKLNIDYKGPLPTNNQNRFILTICDEYLRFPFAFPCRDVSAKSVVTHLSKLFAVFGMPAYLHSDRSSAFMSLNNFYIAKELQRVKQHATILLVMAR